MYTGAEEMVPWLKEFAVLSESLSWALGTHFG